MRTSTTTSTGDCCDSGTDCPCAQTEADVVPPGDALAEGIAAAGIAWDALAASVISHVHLDHTGGLRLVPSGTTVVLQHREWAWLRSGIGRRETVVVDDVLGADVEVRLVDGDTDLAPGFGVLDIRGHTPGHQSVRVDLPDHAVVLACDAADLERNLVERTPCGWVGVRGDEPDAQRSVDRLADLAQLPGVEVWPGHDPAWGGVDAQPRQLTHVGSSRSSGGLAIGRGATQWNSSAPRARPGRRG